MFVLFISRLGKQIMAINKLKPTTFLVITPKFVYVFIFFLKKFNIKIKEEYTVQLLNSSTLFKLTVAINLLTDERPTFNINSTVRISN